MKFSILFIFVLSASVVHGQEPLRLESSSLPSAGLDAPQTKARILSLKLQNFPDEAKKRCEEHNGELKLQSFVSSSNELICALPNNTIIAARTLLNIPNDATRAFFSKLTPRSDRPTTPIGYCTSLGGTFYATPPSGGGRPRQLDGICRFDDRTAIDAATLLGGPEGSFILQQLLFTDVEPSKSSRDASQKSPEQQPTNKDLGSTN